MGATNSMNFMAENSILTNEVTGELAEMAFQENLTGGDNTDSQQCVH